MAVLDESIVEDRAQIRTLVTEQAATHGQSRLSLIMAQHLSSPHARLKGSNLLSADPATATLVLIQ